MPLLVLLSVGTFVLGVGAFGVLGIMTPLSRDLALTPVGAGWVISAYAFAYAVGSPLGTSLTGRLDRRTVLLIGMGLIGLGGAICAIATSATLLYAGRIALAIGSGLYSPAAAGVAVATATLEGRGKALATVYAGLTLSQVGGIPVASYIGATIGWPWLFIAVAAAAAATMVALALRVPRAIAVAPASLKDLGRTLLDVRLTLALALTTTVMGAAWIPYTFLAPIIEEKTGGSAELVGLLLIIYGFGSVGGNVLGGVLVDKVGPNRALAVAALGPLPFFAALTLLPWGPVAGAALLFGWGLFGWTIAVSQQSRLVLLDPARMQVLLALNAACMYLGAALGSTLGGLAKNAGGVPALGIAAVALGLVGVAHLALTVKLSGPRR